MLSCGLSWEKLVQGISCVQGSGPSREVRALLKWTFLVGFCMPQSNSKSLRPPNCVDC